MYARRSLTGFADKENPGLAGALMSVSSAAGLLTLSPQELLTYKRSIEIIPNVSEYNKQIEINSQKSIIVLTTTEVAINVYQENY